MRKGRIICIAGKVSRLLIDKAEQIRVLPFYTKKHAIMHKAYVFHKEISGNFSCLYIAAQKTS